MEANLNSAKRPLSPHLGIYRLPLTALLSISHRITGLALVAGFVIGNLSMVLAVISPKQFDLWAAVFCGKLSQATLTIFLACLSLHMVHGLRHLIWDFGQGFDRTLQHRLALLEILATLLVTLGLMFALHILEFA